MPEVLSPTIRNCALGLYTEGLKLQSDQGLLSGCEGMPLKM